MPTTTKHEATKNAGTRKRARLFFCPRAYPDDEVDAALCGSVKKDVAQSFPRPSPDNDWISLHTVASLAVRQKSPTPLRASPCPAAPTNRSPATHARTYASESDVGLAAVSCSTVTAFVVVGASCRARRDQSVCPATGLCPLAPWPGRSVCRPGQLDDPVETGQHAVQRPAVRAVDVRVAERAVKSPVMMTSASTNFTSDRRRVSRRYRDQLHLLTVQVDA